MLDAAMRRVVGRPLDAVAARLVRAGIGADVVTWAGFAAGVSAAAALAFRQDGLALALIAGNRVLDGVDGAVARRAGPTDLGGYLDIVLDFIFYSGVVFAFAVGRPDQALAAAFLIFSFVGTGSAFLAFAAIAARRSLGTDRYGPKALYYVGGLTEGTETILALAAMCLAPGAFAWIAWGFGALCWLTTAARIRMAHAAFAGR